MAPSLSNGNSFCVKKKTPLTLVSITLSQPFSGYSSNGAPHAAPALFIKISRWLSLLLSSLTNELIPSKFERSEGNEIHSPPYSFVSRSAVASQTSAFLELIYTFAPLAKKPEAIISPIPLEPPVTSATLPFIENKSFIITP